MNLVIQSLWIGSRLSAMERLCIRSFLAFQHEFHLYVYETPVGVPPGVKLRDASEILPSSRIFVYKDHNSYAGFANFFRYKLLLERGGWWCDMDTVALQPFHLSSRYIFSSEGIRGRKTVNAGVIKVPPSSTVMEYAWQRCSQMDPALLKWGESGPRLLAEAVAATGMGKFVREPHVFCPVHFSECDRFLQPGIEWDFGPEVYAIHLWNEMWRRSSCDKDRQYDSDCLYQRLRALYRSDD